MTACKELLACRLIVDGTAAGAWQMAVDEVLLATAAERGLATLRFYGWSEPTLSLGYFQALADRRGHIPSRDCPVVRRQTGGGAILHDQELTYSLALPVAHPLAADPMWMYTAVHQGLKATLARANVSVTLCADEPDPGQRELAFLCFARRARGDVLLGSSKVCGSAQRRRRGALLQHGSLLLAASPHAPELPGILQVCGRRLAAEAVVGPWGEEICQRLGLDLAAGELTDLEVDAVRTLALEKYDSVRWTGRR